MLPLGILKASTKNGGITPNSTTDTRRIFAHSARKSRPVRPRLSSRRASMRCWGVIERPAEQSTRSPIGTDTASFELIDLLRPLHCDAAAPIGNRALEQPLPDPSRD